MTNAIIIFAVSIFLVIKGATLATKYAGHLAESYRLSKYTVGFIIVAVISILPETFIAVTSALEGIPSFGLGMLFGSNVADMTLVFAIIVLLAGREIKIESKVLKDNRVYPFLLLLPLVLGMDGSFSRIEGAALVAAGVAFYYIAFRGDMRDATVPNGEKHRVKNLLMLIASMAALLLGAHYTVDSAVTLAGALDVSPVLIGMLIVGLGTTMPELFFSLRSVRRHNDALAVGDILGTVLADATVVVGIMALINPFSFAPKTIYVTGAFMLVASIILLRFMNSGRKLSRVEAILLFMFWLLFVVVEYLIQR